MLIIGIWLMAVSFVGLVVPFLFKHVFQKYQADRIFSMVGRDNPFVSDSTAVLNSGSASDVVKKPKAERITTLSNPKLQSVQERNG